MHGNPPSPTSTAAVVSLVCGLGSWVLLPFFAAIVAIIAGHMARAEIRRSQIDGDGMAVAGLILGYLNLALTLVIAAAVLFGLLGLGWFLSQHGGG